MCVCDGIIDDFGNYSFCKLHDDVYTSKLVA